MMLVNDSGEIINKSEDVIKRGYVWMLSMLELIINSSEEDIEGDYTVRFDRRTYDEINTVLDKLR